MQCCIKPCSVHNSLTFLMAHQSENSIDHFTHNHPLTSFDNHREFLCQGCKIVGTGKRFRCDGCNFDLHDYCATCPPTLSSFMHCHPLSLSTQKSAAARTSQAARICDVCRDSIEGLFYRCKECKLDVHSLCTQLPEKVNHALHKIHPLTLQTSPTAGFCAVCRRSCGGWRYRCGICSFDIHPECVLEPAVECLNNGQTDRGIPFQPPPFYGYPYGRGYPNFGPGVNMYHGGPHTYTPGPGYPNFGPGFNMYYGGPYMYPPGNFQNFQTGSSNGSNLIRKSMFSLVTRLGFGVVSNMIFGVDLSSVFGGLG